MSTIRLQDNINTLIKDAINSSSYQPADAQTVLDIRSHISKGLSALKSVGSITGYAINIALNGTKISGDITYSPSRNVKDIIVNLSVPDNTTGFDRAMKGVQ